MKKLILLFLMGVSFFGYTQKENNNEVEIVHLSYNILMDSSENKKFLNDKNCYNFIIGSEYFKQKKAVKVLDTVKVSAINLVSIDQFINLSISKRRKLIREGEKSGLIKIPKHMEFFKNIYLYEKVCDSILVYEVEWLDVIVD